MSDECGEIDDVPLNDSEPLLPGSPTAAAEANELLQDTKARALAQARTMAQARSLAQAQYQRPELTDKELEELSVPPVPLDGNRPRFLSLRGPWPVRTREGPNSH